MTENYPPTVQGIKDELARKQTEAENNTPYGMELLGWILDGWVSPYTLISGLAKAVYTFKEIETETGKEVE